MDASNKQETLAEKFAAVWEKKNSKAARAGGVSLMALSLAACGSSSDDTTAADPAPVDPAPVDPAPVTPVAPTPTVNTITQALLDFASGDTLAGTDGDDVLNLEINADLAATTTISGIETIDVTSYGGTTINFTKITDVDKFIISDGTGTVTLAAVSDAGMILGFAGSGTNTMIAGYKAGTLTGSADVVNVDLSGAKAVSLTVDAGFEDISVNTGGAAGAGGQAAAAASDINALTVPGVTKMTIEGAGALDIADGLLDGFATVDASTMTGALTTGTADATTGFVDGDMVGATTASTYTLGAGDDNIGFTGAATAKTNSIKLGDGDDMLLLDPAGAGAIVVMGEGGDDHIRVDTTALTTGDVLNGGAGDDTVTIDVAGANGVLLREVENLVVTATATGTQTITGDQAISVTGKMNNSPTDVQSLPAGSTVTVEKATSTATQASDVKVGFAAAEAASTIEVGGGMTGTLSLSKITDATVNLSAASQLGADISLTSVTDFTLGATGALNTTTARNISDATGTDTLKTVDIDGTKLVKMGTITSTKLETVDLNAATGDLTYGQIGSDSTKLTTVNLTATAGAIAGNADIGKSDGTNVLSVTASAKNAINLADIISTKVGDVSITNTNTVAKDLDVGAIGANATEIGAVTMSGSGDVSLGLIGAGTATATSVGAINLTSTLGKIDAGAALTDVTDADGIEVNLTAATFIDSNGDGTVATLVENTGGNITGTIAGAAKAVVNYTATTSGIVNLTATNTGGLTSTVTNAGTVAAGETSTINMGAGTNSLTVAGVVDNLVINGSTKNDTVTFGSTSDTKVATIALGAGTNSVVYTDLASLSTVTNGDNDNGVVVNLGSSTLTFDSAQTYASTVAAGKATGYDFDGDEGNSTSTSTKVVAGDFMHSLTGITNVTGTNTNDYFVANSTGTTITGGAGDDTVVLGAGADTVVFSDTNGTDTISTFKIGTDALDFTAVTAAGTLAKVAVTNGAADASFTVDGTNTTVYVITTDATDLDGAGTDDTIADFTSAANVGAFLTPGVTTSNTSAEIHYFVLTDGSDTTKSYVWKFTDDGSDTTLDADGSELSLIGSITTDSTAITTAEITIA